MSKKAAYKTFTFDAGAVVALGRDSIKDNTTAIIELVKNSYDADSSEVLIQIITSGNSFIRIADFGVGMSESDVDENWLRIGYSEKKTNKKTKSNRRKTGEKGIGRLSAYRLGNNLKITTKAKGSSLVSLYIDWQAFEQTHIDAENVRIYLLENESLTGPNLKTHSGSGTELLITGLRQHWSKEDIDELHRELENLAPPFKKASDSFKIILENDVCPELNGVVEPPEDKPARVELRASYDGTKLVSYEVFEPKKTRSSITQKSVKRGELTMEQLASVKDQPNLWGTNVGPFSLILKFYPQSSDFLDLIDVKGTALKHFLEFNSGIKIYRDNVRVKPYGDSLHPDGDWLALEERKSRDPAGPSRATYKIANRQVVGGVFITRDKNSGLLDSSSREGLQNGDELHELRSLVIGCITLLEASYHQSFVEGEKKKNEQKAERSPGDLQDSVEEIAQEVANIATSMKALAKEAPEISAELHQIVERTERIQGQAKDVKADVEQLASQATIYRGLATIGITSAVFGHETRNSIGQLLTSLKAAELLLPDGVDKSVREELSKVTESSKNIRAWGNFVLSRVTRDKRRRRKINLKTLVTQIVVEMRPLFDASGIKIDTAINDAEGVYFAMDIESIVMNLLSNAYFACKQKTRDRKVIVTLVVRTASGNSIPVLIISDSGPGVPKVFADEIFEPLFTTKVNKKGKPVGTGLGLTIVKSIVDDIQGSIRVDKDPVLQGAKFSVFLG